MKWICPLFRFPLHIGFCIKDSDCFDGNLCTVDSCLSTNICSHKVDSNCNSVAQTTIERLAPYLYYSFSIPNINQNAFVDYIRLKGALSSVSYVDEYPLDRVKLPFSFPFFGNLINQVLLSPNGGLILPPLGECDSNAVNYFYLYDLMYFVLKVCHLHLRCKYYRTMVLWLESITK